MRTPERGARSAGGGRRRDTLLAGIERMLKTKPDLNLMMIRIFLYAAENPGASVGELADLCGTTDATASRNLKALGDPATAGAEGPLLATEPSATDARGLAVVTTAAGDALVADLERLIHAATPIRAAERA